MASIKLKHASGNSTILNSPAANPTNDVTLKLPSTTGSAGQVLQVASANHSATNAELEFVAAGGGKVVQFKYAQTAALVETTSTSMEDWDALNVAITPTSSSNLLYANLVVNANVYEQSGSDAHGVVGLTDDDSSTFLFRNEFRFYDYGGSGGFLHTTGGGGSHVKTAGNTNARTYKVKFRMVAGDKIVLNTYGTVANRVNSLLGVWEIEP